MYKAVNFILFHVGWFACVLGAGKGSAWLGPAVVLVIIAIHLGVVPHRGRELVLLLSAAGLGVILDSLQVALGMLSFAPGSGVIWLCPLWIVALWFNFATTLNHLLKWLVDRPLAAAMFGAFGGPLAYYGGVKLGAVEFQRSFWLVIGGLAIEWTVAMLLLIALVRALKCSDVPAEQPLLGKPDSAFTLSEEMAK